MSDQEKNIRIGKVLKELNISFGTAVELLARNKDPMENNPNAKISQVQYNLLSNEFAHDKELKSEAAKITASIGKVRREHEEEEEPTPATVPVAKRPEPTEILIKNVVVEEEPVKPAVPEPVVEVEKEVVVEAPKVVEPVAVKDTVVPVQEAADDKVITAKADLLPGAKVIGKIDLSAPKKVAKKEIKAAEPVAEVKPEPVAEKVVEVITPVVIPMQEEPKAEPKIETPIEVSATKATSTEEPKDEVIRAKAESLRGAKILGKIELPVERAGDRRGGPNSEAEKRKRKRKDKQQGGTPVRTDNVGRAPFAGNNQQQGGGGRPNGGAPGNNNQGGNQNRRGGHQAPRVAKADPTDKEIQDQIKATMARLQSAGKPGKFAAGAKLRRQKRDRNAEAREEREMERELESKILKVTEFVTANELAKMMDIQVTQIISTCMSLGMFVSINQRLDAETLVIVAEEFGYSVEFITADLQEAIEEEDDDVEDLLERSPIITVMGHVDHGKTSLLDHVRKANVIAGEAGGITQHIGAYEVVLSSGKKIAFLDTPGHEAFTAMRARGAKITDIVIIVIAADDSVMPQTREAINHAQAAGVPMIFAINKIDKPGANPDKIREELSAMNILVEEWGGKFQCQEISAKKGQGIDELLEKVLIEAELLELKANPDRRAAGTVIEATMDKGKGIVTTIMVQNGTLRVGDPMVAGCYYGRVKSLENERGQRVKEAGPSTPVRVLGMSGAPQAGDKISVLENEQAAKEIANKRLQLQREQSLRTQKHITLDEIGRRLAIGNFKELKLIIKGDVDGSVEALSDSLLKLSTQEIQISILHKSVGQISESDVLLASASDAIIIGFQVRPSAQARKLAEQEQIDIRQYSVIYAAIDEIKQAMEGMLEPTIEERVTGNIQIREVYKISKVGTIAGCYVTDGKVFRNSKIRVIRDGVVIHSGELASLKRFKDDVKEVNFGYECGLNIANFNNIEVGDVIEAYEEVEIKRKLNA